MTFTLTLLPMISTILTIVPFSIVFLSAVSAVHSTSCNLIKPGSSSVNFWVTTAFWPIMLSTLNWMFSFFFISFFLAKGRMAKRRSRQLTLKTMNSDQNSAPGMSDTIRDKSAPPRTRHWRVPRSQIPRSPWWQEDLARHRPCKAQNWRSLIKWMQYPSFFLEIMFSQLGQS